MQLRSKLIEYGKLPWLRPKWLDNIRLVDKFKSFSIIKMKKMKIKALASQFYL